MELYDGILSKLVDHSRASGSAFENDKLLLEPYTYITSNPGKEIRGAMIEAFNVWLEVPADKLKTISKVISMLHNASLLIDDIQDDSQLRRGQPVAHRIYGVPQTINTANYVYFLAYQQLFSLRSETQTNDAHSKESIENMVTSELINLHHGQGLEILWRDSLSCPTEEQYVDMVNNKTGGLLRLAVKLMSACARKNKDIDYVPLVNLIGIFFQIRDDYMNLQSDTYTANKGFAEDLTEGKFSFPIVHSINSDRSNRQILNVLQKRPTTPTLKIHAISILQSRTKSFDYTLGVLDRLEKQTREEIAKLGGNPQLEAIIDQLHVRQE